MSEIQFDNFVAYGIVVDVANGIIPVWRREVYPFCLTNQSHCYMPKLNYFISNITVVLTFVVYNKLFSVLKEMYVDILVQ